MKKYSYTVIRRFALDVCIEAENELDALKQLGTNVINYPKENFKDKGWKVEDVMVLDEDGTLVELRTNQSN